jgi:hypothetical protein
MSRIAIPISGQVLWSTGDVRLWANIRLLLKDFPKKLLQPFALLDHLRFAIDKDPAAGSLNGDLVVVKK